jgi:hypothetical protein
MGQTLLWIGSSSKCWYKVAKAGVTGEVARSTCCAIFVGLGAVRIFSFFLRNLVREVAATKLTMEGCCLFGSVGEVEDDLEVALQQFTKITARRSSNDQGWY